MIKNLCLVFIFMILINSCKLSKTDKKGNENPKPVNMFTDQIPKFDSTSDEFIMFEYCTKEKQCIIGFDDGSGQFFPLPIDFLNKIASK